MRILFDVGVPRGLAGFLPDHEIVEARERGWDRIRNGDLINAAEKAGFDLLLTSDKQIRYQQNLSARTISLVVLSHPHWAMVRQVPHVIREAVEASRPGSYAEIEVPFRKTRRPRPYPGS